MTLKIFRRGASPRLLILILGAATILLCLYYISIGQPSTSSTPRTGVNGGEQSGRRHHNEEKEPGRNHHRAGEGEQSCHRLQIADTDITTMAEYSHFDFQVSIPESYRRWILSNPYQILSLIG